MEKIVGKFITFIFFISLCCIKASQPSIILSILDMNNKPIQQVMVKSQFILQVTCHNVDMLQDISYVPGMDKFTYYSGGRYSNISMYNGKSMHKNIFNFVMKIDSQGVYKLGPLVYSDRSGRIIESNILSITVGNETILSDVVDKNEKYLVITELDKKIAYVGEKVVLQIDFLDTGFVDQCSPVIPDFKNLFVVDVQEQPKKNIQHNNGCIYNQSQWLMHFYPKNKGLSVFDNIKIRFLGSQSDQNIFGRNIFGLMGSIMQIEQEIRARPIGLQVLDLPKVEGFEDVIAVGQFYKIELSVNKNTIQQGDGIVLTVKIFGDGNFEMIDAFPLLLPDGLIFYNSDNLKIDKNRAYRHFEFIVQAQQPGEFHIPSQIFHYFDPTIHQYQTIQSNALDIIVTENKFAQQFHDQDHISSVIQDKNTVDQYIILDQIPSCSLSSKMIPYSTYVLFLKFLYFCCFLLLIYRYFIQKYILSNKNVRYFIMFLKARRACQKADKNNDIAALYILFMRLFLDLQVGSVAYINNETIEEYLKNKNFSDELISQWNVFYLKIVQASFDRNSFHDDDKKIFKEAFIWLELLKEKV